MTKAQDKKRKRKKAMLLINIKQQVDTNFVFIGNKKWSGIKRISCLNQENKISGFFFINVMRIKEVSIIYYCCYYYYFFFGGFCLIISISLVLVFYHQKLG
jgi:hypothetical protein